MGTQARRSVLWCGGAVMNSVFGSIALLALFAVMARSNYKSGKAGCDADLIWCGVFTAAAVDRIVWLLGFAVASAINA